MFKVISLALLFEFLLPATPVSDARFTKYSQFECREVRPGLIMIPTYSAEGKLCQIEIERKHYSRGTVFLDSFVPRDTFLQVIDELVPLNERGRRRMDFGEEYISVYSGNSVTTFADFENVSIEIDGQSKPSGDVVAIISWKNHTCKAAGAIE